MAGIYIYSDKGPLAAELVGFAKTTGKAVNIVTFDQNSAASAAEYGADKVYLLAGDSLLVENNARAAAKFLMNEEAELFLVGSTPRGRDIAARIAGYLQCAMVSDVSSIVINDGQVSTERMIYGGAVIQSEMIDGMAVLTIPPGKFEAASGTAEIATVNINADSRVSLITTAPIVKKGVDISAADKIVCIGLGMEKKQDMQIAQDLAQVLGAEISCTRGIAEERQWLPQYIGISGETVKPSLYLSMGVSGQVQHVVGMREAQIIVGIDINDKAPIFDAADYGIVGDMFEIVPLLIQEIKNI